MADTKLKIILFENIFVIYHQNYVLELVEC